ncbi:protein of unknown function [Methylocella tundrae]|uniref:Uncharacterized protein n=1 Tax=Methylocella tundrae TaxID=227605 RepID=A0A4U8YVS5_METTU|nr:protein of unknown function [Methylocella tundrae]
MLFHGHFAAFRRDNASLVGYTSSKLKVPLLATIRRLSPSLGRMPVARRATRWRTLRFRGSARK